MQRFVLQQNVDRYMGMLADGKTDAESRRVVRSLLVSAQRDLALIDAARCGAFADLLPGMRQRVYADRTGDLRQFQAAFESAPQPYLLLDPGPGLLIVDLNDAYARATMIERTAVVGKTLFEVLPDNPANLLADGMTNLYASLRIVAETGEAHTMAIQRYDVRDANGDFVERHWRPLNMPVFDESGRLVYLLHCVEDITMEVTSSLIG